MQNPSTQLKAIILTYTYYVPMISVDESTEAYTDVIFFSKVQLMQILHFSESSQFGHRVDMMEMSHLVSCFNWSMIISSLTAVC